ncbi:hypothetical protein GCM10017711_17840 [Paeniglutamicibacter sulfureus]
MRAEGPGCESDGHSLASPPADRFSKLAVGRCACSAAAEHEDAEVPARRVFIRNGHRLQQRKARHRSALPSGLPALFR